MGIHKWKTDNYIGLSPALHLQCIVHQPGLEEAQAAVWLQNRHVLGQHMLLQKRHVQKQQNRHFQRHHMQATNCQVLSYLVRGRGTIKKFNIYFLIASILFFFRFFRFFIETPKLALFESKLILKDLGVLLNICFFQDISLYDSQISFQNYIR